MKTIAIAFLVMVSIIKTGAQNYQVTFAGTGAAITVDSVRVENLSQCTSLVLTGKDTLVLSGTVGMNETGQPHDHGISVYPNPSQGNFIAGIEAPEAGTAHLELFGISGDMILDRTEILTAGRHFFQLKNIPGGIYILKIESGLHTCHAKLVSRGSAEGGNVMISNESADKPEFLNGQPDNQQFLTNRTTASKIIMPFNAGDTLKLTGRSGNFRTVQMLFPTQGQTVTFTFVQCADADSNHYAVVQIGSQLWMQENLKTTRYRDGSLIPNVTDSATWGNLTSGGWCDYHNLPAEGACYGHLYNFYAVADSRNLCPAGWHVASHAEWNLMERLLDQTVDTTALAGCGTIIGRILKEGCATRWQYMDTTYGLNSAGFTALCTNYRTATGAWSLAPGDNHDDGFWTGSSYNASSAWFRSLRWCFADIYTLFPMKKSGYSVRCIRN
ncbi:MAG: FISUMP domain-containing protein [Bacteroidota bacterium]